ncbi:GDSL esterase/lipase At4g10955-like [Tripterygium wilfordii]|uniref:GDSL esterase/lipase At4g10955-like n=1 Tax=Tripterygium wilfordii TaxID=458696 RepID=UPI0018F7E975|nr:GDSL esterase/lipase At4g10955-like [Tripterygium wilfordii]
MAKDVGEIFNLSGPFHLTSVDWGNPDHIRSILASFIQGVKIQQRNRKKGLEPHEFPASPWWTTFNFKLVDSLVDTDDNSIFGAIYELESLTCNAPKYVVAFRGTLLKKGTVLRDLKLDLNCVLNNLHKTSRFELAMRAVQNIVSRAGGATDVWLTGYSLGSAIALLAGKEMVKIGHPIRTYLFNPPFLSAGIERIINNDVLKQGIHFTISLLKAGLAIAMKGTSNPDEDFVRLSSWTPNLFVNRADLICCPYIAHFKVLKKLNDIGARTIGRLATRNSIRGLFSSATGNDDRGPLHLIPSAIVTTNLADFPNPLSAHGIKQWWDPSFHGISYKEVTDSHYVRLQSM